MLKDNVRNLKDTSMYEEDIMIELYNSIEILEHEYMDKPNMLDGLNAIKNYLATLEVNTAKKTTSTNIILEALGIESKRRIPYNKKCFFKGIALQEIQCNADLWIFPKGSKPMSDVELIEDLESALYGREVYLEITKGLTHIEFFREFIGEKNIIKEKQKGKERFLKRSGIWVKRYDAEESILRGTIVWTPIDDPEIYDEYYNLFKEHTEVLDIKTREKK